MLLLYTSRRYRRRNIYPRLVERPRGYIGGGHTGGDDLSPHTLTQSPVENVDDGSHGAGGPFLWKPIRRRAQSQS